MTESPDINLGRALEVALAQRDSLWEVVVELLKLHKGNEFSSTETQRTLRGARALLKELER